MEWVETIGKTLEEAKDAALDELGVDEADAEFDVLEEPKQGLFGRTRTEARVRARVRPTAPPPKVERRGARKRVAEVAAPSDDGGAAPGAVQTEDRPEREARPPRPARPPRTRPPREDDGPELSAEEQRTAAAKFLTGLLRELDLEAEVTTRASDEETVVVDITGQDLGVLIGPKGETLQAIQDLTRTAVQKRSFSSTRLMVDVSGYREKRRQALERFAQAQAADVLDSGTRRALEPMSAADRKVIHDTINDIDGVSTASEGEEPRRRIVIQPDS